MASGLPDGVSTVRNTILRVIDAALLTHKTSVTRIVYQDSDEFADAMNGTVGSFIRTAPSASHWWIESVDLAASSMQQLQTGGPFTFAGSGKVGTLTFHVPLTEGGTVRVNGQILTADSFVMLRGEHPFVWSGSSAYQWLTLAVPLNHTLATSALLNVSPSETICRRTSSVLLDGVRRFIHRALFTAPSETMNATWRHSAEEEIAAALTHAVNQSVPAGPGQRIGRPQFSRSRVIANVLVLMHSNGGQPLFIDDLCRVTQVSERALRNMFHEFFSVGPMRLLKLRQLHEIRAALLRTQPQLGTVTHIAARFGVFDPSLLARNYKALFGESPSRTLRRPPIESAERVRVDWLRHASRIFLDGNLTPM